MNVQGGESRDREESLCDSEPVGMAKCCDRRKLVVIASFPMNEPRMLAFMGKKRPGARLPQSKIPMNEPRMPAFMGKKRS